MADLTTAPARFRARKPEDTNFLARLRQLLTAAPTFNPGAALAGQLGETPSLAPFAASPGLAALSRPQPGANTSHGPSAGAGGTMTLDQLIAAIRGQEGGQYHKANPDSGAYGAYQIMPENWAPWAKEAGIPGASPDDEAAQDTVARFKLGQYLEQFGPAGAAQAWYAGPGSVGTNVPGGPNYPDSDTYAQEVTGGAGRGMATSAPAPSSSERMAIQANMRPTARPYAGLDPSMVNALTAATAQLGHPLTIYSGWRPTTDAEKPPWYEGSSQQYLYDHPWLTSAGVVAPPGTSQHELGRASDISDYQSVLGLGLGLQGVAGDPNHVELPAGVNVGAPDLHTALVALGISPDLAAPVVQADVRSAADNARAVAAAAEAQKPAPPPPAPDEEAQRTKGSQSRMGYI